MPDVYPEEILKKIWIGLGPVWRKIRKIHELNVWIKIA
jgi:hypothetical protein